MAVKLAVSPKGSSMKEEGKKMGMVTNICWINYFSNI